MTAVDLRLATWAKLAPTLALGAAGVFAVLLAPSSAKAGPVRTAVCIVEDIAVHRTRVHIRCNYQATQLVVNSAFVPMNKSGDHPPYFAVGISSPMAAPLVALATPMTQQPHGKKIGFGFMTRQDLGQFELFGMAQYQFLVIQYDKGDLSGASFGCLASDCRTPISIWKVQAPGQGD